jgi:hypothetical protein
MDVEALERLAVQLFGNSEQCTDLSLQLDLRRLVNELVDLIEGPNSAKALRWRNSLSRRERTGA